MPEVPWPDALHMYLRASLNAQNIFNINFYLIFKQLSISGSFVYLDPVYPKIYSKNTPFCKINQ